MASRVRALRHSDTTTARSAVDGFLASPRCANPNTQRAYASALDRLLDQIGGGVVLSDVSDQQLAQAVQGLWGQRAPATWNRNRAAVAAWLTWCQRARLTAPSLPASTERRREPADHTRALNQVTLERAISGRDVPLREKTLWRMLFETAARASEVLALNIEDLDLDARRAPIRSKGGDTEWIFWGSGTAHLLPRLLQARTRGVDRHAG